MIAYRMEIKGFEVYFNKVNFSFCSIRIANIPYWHSVEILSTSIDRVILLKMAYQP